MTEGGESRGGTVGLSTFEFSKAEIQSRIVDHWEFADDFIEAYMGAHEIDPSEVRIIVSQRRLAMATDSAYQDIARYKNYHLKEPWSAKLDCIKRSAYLLKWISRFKPLMVVSALGEDPDINNLKADYLELANEFFCLYLFEMHLSQEIGIDVALSDQKGKELAYDLLYRGINVEGWIGLFQMVKDCAYPNLLSEVPFIERL
jgi:hypothetical protein